MAADPPAAADDLPDSERPALAAFASDVTRALLAEITPAKRTAGKNNEIQRMDAVVLAAQEKESERLRASKVRNELATARGAATTQQTLDDGVVTKGLASRVQEAKVERTALKKTIPGQPHFLAAAMDTVRNHISEEEELELTPQQRAVVHEAVMLEVNKNVRKPAGRSYTPLPTSSSCDILIQNVVKVVRRVLDPSLWRKRKRERMTLQPSPGACRRGSSRCRRTPPLWRHSRATKCSSSTTLRCSLP
jgi:hypothetical protein